MRRTARTSRCGGAFPLAFAALLALAPVPAASAQTPAPTPAPADDIQITIRGGGERRLPIAVPALFAPGTAALQAQVVDPFTATLRADLEYAGAFAVAEPALYPTGFRDPSTPEAADRWLGTGAEALVDTRGEVSGDKVSIEARVWDLKARKLIMGRRYSGGASYVERIAHTLANDIVKYFTGKPGVFLSIDPLRDPGGRQQGNLGDGFRRPRRPPADLAQVDRDQPDRRQRPDRLHLLRRACFPCSGRWMGTAATSARSRREWT